ncbi:hypothetical protein BIM11_6192 [Burkholderia pseudomallei]|nr:hypothetical protein BIM11_6192 [Burkholderia pseudomallei]
MPIVAQRLFELGQIPLLLDAARRHELANHFRDHAVTHRADRFGDVVRFEQLVALLVDHLALIVRHVVVFEQLLADIEVARFDLALRGLDRTRDDARFDRLALRHLQAVHDRAHAVAREDAQQRILERQVEARRARIALTARAAAQLIVDPARLVALGADDVQAARGLHLLVQRFPLVVQLLDAARLLVGRNRFVGLDERRLLLDVAAEHDIGAAARHVRRDRDALRPARLGDDRRFARVLLRVQHLVRQARLLEQVRQQLRVLDRRRADEHGLAALVALADVADHRVVALLRGLVDLILLVDPLRRPVGRDHDRLEAVDLVEFVRLGVRRARHARELRVHPEVVLERDRRERLVLALDLHVLLRLDRLVQAVGPAAARHQAAREFVDDDHLVVLHDVVLIAMEQRVRAQRRVHMVHQRDVLRRVEALAVADQAPFGEHPLGLLMARLGQEHLAALLVERVVARLLDARAVRLLLADLALEQRRQRVHPHVQLGVILSLARDDERRARFVDQDRVDFVDHREIQRPLHARIGLVDHVVAQVVETEFVVRAVRDVGCVRRLLLVVLHPREVDADRKPEEVVEPAHPLGVALREVIVDRHDVHAAAGERVQVRGERRDERLALARAHFGDLAVMQHHPADHLHIEVAHLQHAAARLAAHGERLGQELVERLADRDALTELPCLAAQLVVRQRLDLRFKRIDRRDGLLVLLDEPLIAAAKNFLKKTGYHRIGCASVQRPRSGERPPRRAEPRRLSVEVNSNVEF